MNITKVLNATVNHQDFGPGFDAVELRLDKSDSSQTDSVLLLVDFDEYERRVLLNQNNDTEMVFANRHGRFINRLGVDYSIPNPGPAGGGIVIPATNVPFTQNAVSPAGTIAAAARSGTIIDPSRTLLNYQLGDFVVTWISGGGATDLTIRVPNHSALKKGTNYGLTVTVNAINPLQVALALAVTEAGDTVYSPLILTTLNQEYIWLGGIDYSTIARTIGLTINTVYVFTITWIPATYDEIGKITNPGATDTTSVNAATDTIALTARTGAIAVPAITIPIAGVGGGPDVYVTAFTDSSKKHTGIEVIYVYEY